jgi:hypothetical protein
MECSPSTCCCYCRCCCLAVYCWIVGYTNQLRLELPPPSAIHVDATQQPQRQHAQQTVNVRHSSGSDCKLGSSCDDNACKRDECDWLRQGANSKKRKRSDPGPVPSSRFDCSNLHSPATYTTSTVNACTTTAGTATTPQLSLLHQLLMELASRAGRR